MITQRPPRRTALSILCRPPQLTFDEERRLFAELRDVKSRLERCSDESRRRSRLQRDSIRLRNRIATGNLRLAVSVAKQFATPEMTTEDLVAAGMPPLIRAVELFDPARGNRFSTYATHALRNHFLRLRRRRVRRNTRESAMTPAVGDSAMLDAPSAEDRLERADLIGAVRKAMSGLPERDRHLLAARFGLQSSQQPQTMKQIADSVGLSKERVRVLTHRAVDRLRELLEVTEP